MYLHSASTRIVDGACNRVDDEKVDSRPVWTVSFDPVREVALGADDPIDHEVSSLRRSDFRESPC
jgi:hypothetical protein